MHNVEPCLNNKNKMFINKNMPFEFYILCFVVFSVMSVIFWPKVSKKEFDPMSGGFTITSSDEGNVESRREVNQSVDGKISLV